MTNFASRPSTSVAAWPSSASTAPPPPYAHSLVERRRPARPPPIIVPPPSRRRRRRHHHLAQAPASNVLFDETGKLIIYPTLFGVKVVDRRDGRLIRLLGKVENTERFIGLALFQGAPAVTAAMAGSGVKITGDDDPVLVCCAFKRSRFYLFSTREPEDPQEGDEVRASAAPNPLHHLALQSTAQHRTANPPQVGRDIFNEKPTKDDLELVAATASGPLPRSATINTSYGEIRLKLFPDECPKTVENFTTHARNGYYDGVIFHRVIKGFMVQTGDPLGDGTGGTSVWGHEFEDEFHRSLRHDRPYTLSMANAGPNTNGSQFFITTAPTTWLDNKHTVFGRVVQGTDVVQGIEKVKTSKDDRPVMDIKILSIMCSD